METEMPIFENNRDLLERFRRGEHAALTEVYNHYAADVLLLARRGFTTRRRGPGYVWGEDEDGAHDLVQETFAKAFSDKARTSFDGLRPYRPFLLRIAKNLMIDRLRARPLECAREYRCDVTDIDTRAASNEQFVIDEDLVEDLYRKKLLAVTSEFLASLDPESRAVVSLRLDRQLSQDDAAYILGCSRRRVRTLEGRVQNQLRRRMRALGLAGS